MTSQRENPKCARACEYCRLKKIKCDAKQPCKNCVLRHEECITIPLVRKNTRERHRLLQLRAERAEARLAAAGIANLDEPDSIIQSPPASNGELFLPSPLGESARDSAATITTQVSAIESPRSAFVALPRHPSFASSHRPQASMNDKQFICNGDPVVRSITPLTWRQDFQNLSRPPYSDLDDSGQSQARTSMISPTETSTTIEHHGPQSWLSICSDSGVRWVSQKIGIPDFNNSASSLTNVISRGLKMQQMNKHQRPEPDRETAWSYTKAYFEHTVEADIGSINRRTFEARLQVYMDRSEMSDPDEDPAWYALRNIVYAFGCRFLLCQKISRDAWAEAQNESWRFFENALLVHTELVYFPSSSSAVQALLVMALFVEGMGVPKLEYMLISNALRLAHSKALHLQPPASSRIPLAEIAYRSWLWWSIYIYEKHIAYRSGRPSAIDDDEITCEFPTIAPNGKEIHVKLFTSLIEHAQISSSTMRSLSRTKAAQRSPAELISTVEKLDRRLYSWYQSIPESLRLDLTVKKSNLPEGIQLEHLLYIHLAYHGSLISIHSFLGYPWNLIGFASDSSRDLTERMESSTRIVAEASRNLILATRDISIDAEAPAWLIFYYPLLGMINLFIHILRFPALPTVSSDIQLMDMIAAYFGYIDFSTASRLSFPFTRDIAHWARMVSEKARSTQATLEPSIRAITPPESTVETFGNVVEDDFMAQVYIPFDFFNLANFDPIEFGGVEDWPNFLSSMSQVPLMAWNDFSGNGESNGRWQ
ncbi:hypothetical protein BU16DRAFT_564980 [Lophium mytilinum]|uniref:Zn(2)-C6 fungal-type domain-containing protein n=1 Tax=Lophium mytilinum TaxID=390894 RepID=A0A6A6QHZ4_9PEZI|nr:hypothetical protein BU16DRAFT_564980 [Lophium mytilinum]